MTTTTDWALGIVASLLVAVVTATARLFSRMDKAEARIEGHADELRKIVTDEHECRQKREQNEREMFSLLREMREIVVGVQIDVAAIRRNGHEDK